MKSRKIFAFAGITSQWKSPEGEIIKTCSIITTDSNSFMSKIHNRMPVILTKKDEALWIDPKNTDIQKLNNVLKPYDSDDMTEFVVSAKVNTPKNNSPELINPVKSLLDFN